jgi:hypothetical protein
MPSTFLTRSIWGPGALLAEETGVENPRAMTGPH